MGLFRYLALAAALSACSPRIIPHYPANPDQAADSVFMVTTSVNGEVDSTGTAWVFRNEDTGSYLLTAGHVCPLSGGDNSYELTSRDGTTYHAYELMRSDDPDLCELYSPATVGFPLAIADRGPGYGDGLYVIGAPHGIYGTNNAPLYKGLSIGNDQATGKAIPGLSGSPVISERGVVGVLVEGYFRDDIYHYMSVTQIQSFLGVE